MTPLGLCGATFGGVVDVKKSAAEEIVAATYAVCIRYFDTAPLHGCGKSEHLVANQVRGRQDIVLSTKVGRRLKVQRSSRPQGDMRHDPIPLDPLAALITRCNPVTLGALKAIQEVGVDIPR